MNIKDMLRDARLPEKTVDICLRGDLVSEYERIEARIQQATENRRDSLSAGAGTAELREQLAALRRQMTEATVAFRLRALPRREFQAMREKHPPRRDGDTVNEGDAMVGFNRSTFIDELLPGCVVEPVLDSEDWDVLLGEKLTDGQFNELGATAMRLNWREVDVPFSPDDSPPTPD